MTTYARTAQFVTEVLCTSASSARIGQFVVEVLCTGSANIRLANYVVEALVTYNPTIRVSSTSAAVLYTQNPTLRVQSISVAVLGSIQQIYLSSSSLAVSDEATYTLGSPIYSEEVEDSIVLDHVLARVFFDIQVVSDTIEIDDVITPDVIRFTSSELPLEDDIGLNYTLQFLTSSEIVFDEVVGRIFNDVQLTDDTVVITDLLLVNFILNLPTDNTLTVTDEALGSRIKFAGNTVIFVQTVGLEKTNTKVVTSTLTLVSTVSVKIKAHKPILHWLSGSDLLMQHVAYWLHEIPRSISDSFTVSDIVILGFNLSRTATSALVLIDTTTVIKTTTVGKIITDTLSITDAASIIDTVSKEFEQTLSLSQNALGLVLNERLYMLLQAPYDAPATAVILPNPLLDDGESTMVDAVIRKAMDNTAYSFVKRTKNRRLKYTFQLNERKGDELKAFTTQYNAAFIKLQNWKGEIWKVQIITNPVEYTAAGKWGPIGDRIEVNLEFEGIRIF